MADSVYKSANLTPKQLDFIRLLDDFEIDIFLFTDIERQIHHKFENLNEILENLVDKKIIARIEKGKFCRSNFRNENVIGCFLVPDGVVSYWSALNKHGLTDQFPNVLFIQTSRNKQEKNVFGTTYKFVRVHSRKVMGIISEGNGNNQFRITDIEKTLVDCFDLPEHSGGYAELLRAFSQAKFNSDKMIDYCTAIDNIAATKRMGFIAELLDKKGLKTFIKFAKQRINFKYNVFDPAGTDKGEFVNDWRLRLNISREEILDICNKQF